LTLKFKIKIFFNKLAQTEKNAPKYKFFLSSFKNRNVQGGQKKFPRFAQTIWPLPTNLAQWLFARLNFFQIKGAAKQIYYIII